MTYEIIQLHPIASQLTGQTFGRLTAIAPVGRGSNYNIIWLCICVCGTEHVTTAINIRSGKVKSCGCLIADANIKERQIHGMCRTPEYYVFNTMLQRCNNKKNHKYPLYGGRGIKVLYSSLDDFLSDVGRRPSNDLSIDRINNDGNYEKGNCRWATWKQQANNRRKR